MILVVENRNRNRNRSRNTNIINGFVSIGLVMNLVAALIYIGLDTGMPGQNAMDIFLIFSTVWMMCSQFNIFSPSKNFSKRIFMSGISLNLLISLTIFILGFISNKIAFIEYPKWGQYPYDIYVISILFFISYDYYGLEIKKMLQDSLRALLICFIIGIMLEFLIGIHKKKAGLKIKPFFMIYFCTVKHWQWFSLKNTGLLRGFFIYMLDYSLFYIIIN